MTKACASGQSSVIDRSIRASWPGGVRALSLACAPPVNFMVGIKGKSFTVSELEAAGVRRISLATSLYRAAMSGLVEAAREAKDKGTFG